MKTFENLVTSISGIHQHLQSEASRAVNQVLTIRNWMIGMYIIEFEQNGDDRAKYGEGLIPKLARKLKIKGLTGPELSRCRQFYGRYPGILGSVTQKIPELLPESILGSLTQELKSADKEGFRVSVPADMLIAKLSYTHLVELIKIENDLKRTFYEVECIKGTWSVRELKRQIGSLYFERSGLSSNPEKQSQISPLTNNPLLIRQILSKMSTHSTFWGLGAMSLSKNQTWNRVC